MRPEHSRSMGRRATFGVEFDPIGFTDVLARIEHAIEERRRLVIGYLNLHGAHLYQASPGFRQFIDTADIAYADGVPLMVWRRLLWSDCASAQRFTLTHRMIEFMTLCRDRGWRVHYVGSDARVLEDGMQAIRSNVPGIVLTGQHGFFSRDPGGSECEQVVAQINASHCEVVMVGMGMPVQEQWIGAVAERLQAPVIWAVGGAIEYYSGHVAMAPAWVNGLGLEWAFRLAQRPRRFAHRYLVEPFSLLPAVVADVRRRFAPPRTEGSVDGV